MATKAQRFRVQQQRDANPPRPKSPRRLRRDVPIDTALPGVSATDRKVGLGASSQRNRSERAKKKGGAKLENSASGRPSRKSTRKSEGRIKRTTNLRQRAVRKASSPGVRARKSKARDQ